HADMYCTVFMHVECSLGDVGCSCLEHQGTVDRASLDRDSVRTFREPSFLAQSIEAMNKFDQRDAVSDQNAHDSIHMLLLDGYDADPGPLFEQVTPSFFRESVQHF